MTGAELRAFRQSLGLGSLLFERAVGLGGGGRTVRRWEAAPDQPIPGPVATLVALSRDIPEVRSWLRARATRPPE
jgi:hypothetical protein